MYQYFRALLLIVVIAIACALVLYVLLVPGMQFAIGRVSKHTSPILPLDLEFAEHTLFRDNWKAIRDEALGVVDDAKPANKVSPLAFTRLNPKQKWSLFLLRFYGRDFAENQARCPITTGLLNRVPRVHLAMFSILQPHTEIPVHKGAFRGCTRYHLGLEVPSDRTQCYIRVHDQKYSWAEGEGVLFDDTYRHSVRNDSDERRVILFLDVERELRPGFVARLNRRVIRSAVPHYLFFANQKKERAEHTKHAMAMTIDDPAAAE